MKKYKYQVSPGTYREVLAEKLAITGEPLFRMDAKKAATPWGDRPLAMLALERVGNTYAYILADWQSGVKLTGPVMLPKADAKIELLICLYEKLAEVGNAMNTLTLAEAQSFMLADYKAQGYVMNLNQTANQQ